MSIIKLIASVLEQKAADLYKLRVKRYERVNKAYSEVNNGLAPTTDAKGRLHAPCDGYEDVDGRGIYGKGEFIPFPEMWNVDPLAYEAKDYRWSYKVKIINDEHIELSLICHDYGIDVFYGKSWDQDGIKCCYAYLKGDKTYITTLQNFVEVEAKRLELERREAAKVGKGTAPVGRQTVKGIVMFTKVTYGDFGASHKFSVQFENGSTAFGTLPAKAVEAKKGDEIEFSATFKHSDGDETHAWFSRPSFIELNVNEG